MGTIRELSRMNWHVYKVFKDVTPEKFAPTLADAGFHVTAIVLDVLSYDDMYHLAGNKISKIEEKG